MKTLKILGWYYLAGLTYLLYLILFVTIILIPVLVYLLDLNWWFIEPFEDAKRKAEEIRGE